LSLRRVNSWFAALPGSSFRGRSGKGFEWHYALRVTFRAATRPPSQTLRRTVVRTAPAVLSGPFTVCCTNRSVQATAGRHRLLSALVCHPPAIVCPSPVTTVVCSGRCLLPAPQLSATIFTPPLAVDRSLFVPPLVPSGPVACSLAAPV
jgi:hypothetical protein